MSNERILGQFTKSEFYHNRFLTTEQRFWSKVALTADPTRCWEWQRNKDAKGYGLFWYRGGMRRSHRMGFELFNHRVPTLHILHKCDNSSCVNPHHLYEDDNAQNMRDRVERDRQHKGESCPLSKLTDTDVLQIRRLLREGHLSQTAIGHIFNVWNSTISSIKRRHTWKHLPEEV